MSQGKAISIVKIPTIHKLEEPQKIEANKEMHKPLPKRSPSYGKPRHNIYVPTGFKIFELPAKSRNIPNVVNPSRSSPGVKSRTTNNSIVSYRSHKRERKMSNLGICYMKITFASSWKRMNDNIGSMKLFRNGNMYHEYQKRYYDNILREHHNMYQSDL